MRPDLPSDGSSNQWLNTTLTNSGGGAEGSFVGTPDGKVYRIVGGAPLYVSDWAPLGGAQPVTPVSDLSGFAAVPADGATAVSAEDGRFWKFVVEQVKLRRAALSLLMFWEKPVS